MTTSILPRLRALLPAALLAAPLAAQAPAPALQVTDLTPKFLAFHDSAAAVTDAEARWQLWQRLYGFAAVPPTPAGQARARQLLDANWPKYADALPRIRQGMAAWPVAPAAVLAQVDSAIGCGRAPRVRLIAFVGAFDGNAFAFTTPDGVQTVAIPVEAGDARSGMTHEFAHAVHAACAGFAATYVKPLAQLVLTEGLAIHTVGELLPGRPLAATLNGPPAWAERCRAEQGAVVRGLRDQLAVADRAVIERFTFGTGATGMPREAYCAGWAMVAALRERGGMTLRQLATVPEAEMVALMTRAAALLEGPAAVVGAK